jgi:hypothetical protein
MHTSMSTNPLWQRLHWLGCIEAESAFVSQGGGMDADVHSPKRHGSRSTIGTSVTFGLRATHNPPVQVPPQPAEHSVRTAMIFGYSHSALLASTACH